MSDKRDVLTTDKLHAAMRGLDEIELPMDPAFFDNLHDKIMDRVEQTQMTPPDRFIKPKKFLRAHWRGWLYPTGGTMALALAVSLLVSHINPQATTGASQALLDKSGELVVAEALQNAEDITQTLISSQLEADFFVDVAAQSIENLKIYKVMGESGK